MIQLQQALILSPYIGIYDLVVPKNNLLRQINELVDLSFVYNELRDKYCLDNGRNAISPIRMFKYLLLKSIYDISDIDVVERSKYDMRWDIETFFKCTKSLLRLQKEFQGRSYDTLVSHTTIVLARYILLSWQHRQHSDERTLGGLFLAMCDEISNLDWAVALQQLLEILNDVSKKVKKPIVNLIKSQLQHWFAGLPSYIKAYLPNLCCES